jgi:hypothetical protein
VRPHARQRKIGMSSSFFLRVPFLIRRLLLQWGQRSGGLIVERCGAAGCVRLAERVMPLVREGICKGAYHAAPRICKSAKSSLVGRVFGTVVMYADLSQVRAWRLHPQLDFAGVFEMRKPESVMPVLFSELSTRQKTRAVPTSRLYVQGVFTADRSA